ncbi:hypothetical protein BHE74_00046149 [Ensete ventricosum]|nr:hypothetical protein GW17_00040710 [Ensete ventricosum]RWW47828.1 hypothetical protein BHE74_00046149 [Ensete ventricosum]RZS08200.1 hypothetical protein BHM03_00039167 [Ensete ventricosum]
MPHTSLASRPPQSTPSSSTEMASRALSRDTKLDRSRKKQKVETRRISERVMAREAIAWKVGGSGEVSRSTS